jgi:hypothetical protein
MKPTFSQAVMGLAPDPIEAEGAVGRRGRPTTERRYGRPNP